MKILQGDSNNYLARVGAIETNKQLFYRKIEKISVADVMYCPELEASFEIMVVK